MQKGGLPVNIHEPAEDSLAAILRRPILPGQVRSLDTARQLGGSKPSVSVAMKRLRENGYIEMAANGSITLLAPGREIAEHIYERHRLLTDFFVALGVSEDVAAADACKIEHDLSDETFSRLQAHASQYLHK